MTNNINNRGTFATKVGVIAATVGSAVGLGNIWRFPYEAGVHGGGAFIFIYIICIALMGIPVMVAEFVIGRASQKNLRGAFEYLTPGKRWKWVSYMGITASILILSFYSVVAGWTLRYTIDSISGELFSHNGDLNGYFNIISSSDLQAVAYTIGFLIIDYIIIRKGIQNGIERISNILMPILFILLLFFCINSLLMPKAAEGLEFLFLPNFSAITPKVVLGAMGQAFFSLSLGLGALITYASYFKRNVKLMKSASIVAGIDTIVAILAGIIIFPAVFSYGASPEAGPRLVFVVLPEVFAQMPLGQLLSPLFFFLLFVASLTSTISMSEISISFFIEEYGIKRSTATKLNIFICMILGTICALSFGILKDVTVSGLSIFNLFDYVASNICLPLGGMIISIYAGYILDRKIIYHELGNDNSKSLRVAKYMIFCMKWVAPIAIAIIFIYGLGII